MNTAPSCPKHDAAEEQAIDGEARTSFWHWFAIGVVVVCWIAEATMCAERGF